MFGEPTNERVSQKKKTKFRERIWLKCQNRWLIRSTGDSLFIAANCASSTNFTLWNCRRHHNNHYKNSPPKRRHLIEMCSCVIARSREAHTSIEHSEILRNFAPLRNSKRERERTDIFSSMHTASCSKLN